jgi:hypothetical protein
MKRTELQYNIVDLYLFDTRCFHFSPDCSPKVAGRLSFKKLNSIQVITGKKF